MEENKPLGSDSELDEVLNELEQEEGAEDVESQGVSELSLEEINKISGREFKDKDDFFKHYENLKSFVGKKEEKVETKEEPDVKSELQELKKDLARKDFVIANPELKEYVDVIEAYAEKNGISLEEAGNSEKFQSIAKVTTEKRGKELISKTRINPVQTQRISQLAQEARQGSDKAAEALVMETIWKK